MTDRPIIFSAPMVRALLEGRKTQTRRVLKAQPDFLPGRLSWPHQDDEGRWVQTATDWVYSQSLGNYEPERERDIPLRLPYAPGDRLYVREAFSYDRLDVDHDGALPPWYWADGNPDWGDWTRRKPSIHMPRWASRLTLTVTEVRVQRLQDISEADAGAEGVEPRWPDGGIIRHDWTGGVVREAFRDLWNSLYGPDAWGANPWVVAFTFTVDRRNIDGARYE